MRNRTRGPDFPSFFSAHERSRTSFAIAFVCVSGNGKGSFLVVGRVRFLVKPSIFEAGGLLEWREGPPARLIRWGSEQQEHEADVCTAARWHTDEPLCRPSPVEIRLCGGRTNRYASTSLTQLSCPARAAQVSGFGLPTGIPGPENASAGVVCGMDGLHPQVCHQATQPRRAQSPDYTATSIAQYRPRVQQALFLAWKATHGCVPNASCRHCQV